MKNPIILMTAGNQRTAFNRATIVAVMDQGAGRNARLLLMSGDTIEVLHSWDTVMEGLQNAEPKPGNTEANPVPPSRNTLRNR